MLSVSSWIWLASASGGGGRKPEIKLPVLLSTQASLSDGTLSQRTPPPPPILSPPGLAW